ncbi:Uncharacterized protein TCM_029593 [Theobroma cacao]|uniref:Uncharacterized protein n=1 Tax=Theobroma cacao TaxID=3641 RepID=A0A061GL95_THECC|nr:Uncharacterized protein TCM_029593 [Theobroma cacao]
MSPVQSQALLRPPFTVFVSSKKITAVLLVNSQKLNRVESTAMASPPRASALLFFLLATTVLQPVNSLSYSQYKSLCSFSHSLLTRVANLRSSRGDAAGSNRARLVAEKLERWQGVGFWGAAWSVGWDYVWNYAWRGNLNYGEIHGVVSDLNQLGRMLGELSRSNSEMERASWIARNYGNALAVSKRLLNRLLKAFKRSGALREVIETVEREVVEGGLLRDCLEIGSNDLKGLVQIFKELSSQFFSASDYSQEL